MEKVKHLIKETASLDKTDILSCLRWLIDDTYDILLVSCMGDLFLIRTDNTIHWLATDSCTLTQIADNSEHFEQLLKHDELINEWFLPQLVQKLVDAGMFLNQNEVYSYLKLPVIGGEYAITNIKPTDMSVRFAFSGQICEQIQHLPDGTKIKIRVQLSDGSTENE